MSTKKAFETENGNKQRCRDLLCLYAKEHLPSVEHIITLPSRKCLCIKTFKRHFPKALVTAVEQDYEIVAAIREKKYFCHYSTIRQYVQGIASEVNHVDITFLDYYAYLQTEIVNDLRDLLENRNLIHKGKSAIIGLTLQKNMRGKKTQGLDFMRDNIYEGHRKRIENTAQNVQDAITNYITCELPDLEEFKFLYQYEYKANNNSTDMYFFIMKVIT